MRSVKSRQALVACGVVFTALATSVLVATPAAALPNLAVVSASSSTDLGGFKAVRVFCPANTKIVGGGGSVVGGGDSVHLYLLRPEDNEPVVDSFMAAGAAHDKSYPSSAWSLTVWAICASGVTGHSVVHAVSTDDPYALLRHATAYCPPGKKVIGAGGLVYKSAYFLDTVSVSANLDYVNVEGFRSEYALPGTGMGVEAYAVCVDPVPGMQRVAVSSGYTSGNKVVTVSCPAGTQLHGTAGSLTGAAGQAYIEALAPWGTYGVIFSAREDATGYSSNWHADVYAICAH